MESLYPAGPTHAPANLSRPGMAYRSRAWRAVAVLFLFMLFYCTLAGWLVFTAYRLLSEAVAGGEDAALGYFAGGCAAFLAVFMLKGLFFLSRGRAPDAVEIKEDAQPRLFAFLNRLADDTGAPRPARVYVSARVNACVFYDLSLLNLLFPSRKNLEIGLALVNVLSLSELKAVLAHEFGHFAQRSMAIGCWVYIAQQVAVQLITRRDALDKTLAWLASTDLRIAWIGWSLSLVVWSVRSLMDTMLTLVVLAQRALSRQMEFQADLVAVAVTGSDELVHALHKLHAADEAWNRTMGFVDGMRSRKQAPADMFALQTHVIGKLGRIYDDPDYGKAPPLPPSDLADERATHRVFASEFAQPPQMWSTHPSNADRERNIKNVYVLAPHDDRSAWTLFERPEELKLTVQQHALGEIDGQSVPLADSLSELNEQYDLQQHASEYRGAYLGRSMTLHVANAADLYDLEYDVSRAKQEVPRLYPASLSDLFDQWRNLLSEQTHLQALQDKVYKATGGKIVVRGQELDRGDLPDAIARTDRELEHVQKQIWEEDRKCRSVHMALARSVSPQWKDYLQGLIAVLHWAEHTANDLHDAYGAYRNIFRVVTVDGKVTKSEKERLLSGGKELYSVLAAIHASKAQVQLDPSVRELLEIESWAQMLEDFSLPAPTMDNLGDWVSAIESWVDYTSNALLAVVNVTMEKLLTSEALLRDHVMNEREVSSPSTSSQVPSEYPVRLAGSYRERQKRLGIWDRFKIGDGLGPSLARVLIAGSIVGSVLAAGSYAGSTSSLSIYNGLARTVVVGLANERITVAPHAAALVEVNLDDVKVIETSTIEGEVVESLSPEQSGHLKHYVYNIAGASPLVEWTQVYGTAHERPPRYLSAPTWTTSSVDVFFAEPPTSVRTKHGGATRDVLSGASDAEPADVLKLVKPGTERQRMIAAHIRWDDPADPHAAAWKALSEEQPQHQVD